MESNQNVLLKKCIRVNKPNRFKLHVDIRLYICKPTSIKQNVSITFEKYIVTIPFVLVTVKWFSKNINLILFKKEKEIRI